MGSNETAITIRGGPRIIVIFDVQRRAKAQIKHFFWMQTGSQTPCGLYLLLVRRLHRTRRSLGQPIALKALDQNHWQITPESAGLLRELVDMIQAPAYTA